MLSSDSTTIACEDAGATSSAGPCCSACRRRWGPVPITLLAALAVGGAYTAYQRIGTTANADVVEYTQNLAGGFLAVGTTADEPGFVVVSLLDRPRVQIDTDLADNAITGRHTLVRVATSQAQWRKRLRGPQVVLISRDGRIEALAVDWSFEEFTRIRQGVDCDHGGTSKRCGAPFADLHVLLTRPLSGPSLEEHATVGPVARDGDPPAPQTRVPERVIRFLAPFADKRRH